MQEIERQKQQIEGIGGINRLQNITNALGSPSKLNSKNLQTGLRSLRTKLSEKVECVVCDQTFYKSDTLVTQGF